MYKSILILALCLTVYDCGKRNPQPQPTPYPTPTAEPTVSPILPPTPTPTPIVQPCSLSAEDDITPALRAAIANGTEHSGGGCIRTQLIVDGALKLGEGVYQSYAPILVKSGGSIVAANWSTVIMGFDEFTVIAAYNSWEDGIYGHAASDSNITLKGFKIIGTGKDFSSVYQTVSLGNCHHCIVDGLWLDRTLAIGVQLGGANDYNGERVFASDSKITNNLLTRVASQSVALVNGQNIEISGNKFLAPGQVGGPGNTSIDLEINNDNDRLVNIQITNNTINHAGSEMPTTGNAMQITSGDLPHAATRNVGNILIADNTIIGGRIDPPENKMSNGIIVAGTYMTGVTIKRNKITRTGQTGMWLAGTNIIAEDNELDSVGGGGIEGFRMAANNSQIRRNSLKCSGGPCDARMIVTGTGNTIESNTGFSMVQGKRPIRKTAK